jgi:dipeptidyl aminopeptidase/acylaminoacyl peptidase
VRSQRSIVPYGAWASPISSAIVAAQGSLLTDLRIFDGEAYWSELRPSEGGRTVIVRSGVDVTPAPYSARSRVHEYGGGAFTVSNDTVWFTNEADQQVYRQRLGGSPRQITSLANRRYADYAVAPSRGLIYAVAETHNAAGQPQNCIVRIGLDGERETVLVSGNDFYSDPRVSPDGSHLCWLTWNHPRMPWDGTELWVGWLDAAGDVHDAVRIDSSERDSILQPTWSPSGVLYFVSDRSGWWNLFRLDASRIPRSLKPLQAEFGVPQWFLARTTFAIGDDGRIACSWIKQGIGHLGILVGSDFREVRNGFTTFASVCQLRESIYCIASSPTRPQCVIRQSMDGGPANILHSVSTLTLAEPDLSRPELLEYESYDRARAFAFYYPPTNSTFLPLPSEKPPAVIFAHGGPTSSYDTSLDLAIQFWTTRGFAVLCVNYRGSSGYGTQFRRSLNGLWGVVDVEDCIAAAHYAVAAGLADIRRLAIAGASSGGFTALMTLVSDVSPFSAAMVRYGVSDLVAFGRETHKFESHYLETLVAAWPAGASTYIARSPISHLDRLSAQLIMLHGAEDAVVRPAQSRRMVEALRSRGLRPTYIEFEGERHGFRRATSIVRAFEAEFTFLRDSFRIEPAGSEPD